MSTLESIRLGHTTPTPYVSRLGMGCWPIGGHGGGRVKDEDSIKAIRCALENGVTFFDTADTYGLGKSETLLANTLGSSRSHVVIASKGGVRWNESGKIWTDNSPAYLRFAIENSLRRLKLDCIPLYYIHKPDDITPIQESIAALERIREEGKIGAIGVANFSADQLQQALQAACIAAIQVRLNIFDRTASKDLLGICREHGITLVAWGALADGLLTGKFTADTTFSDDDHRSRMPEFSRHVFFKYGACVKSLERLAGDRGRKVSQLALRWVLDFEPFTCSLFGAKTDTQVLEDLGADGWSLTKDEFAAIDSIVAELRG
jgi:myo-inositol catabolism protein IolS